MPSDVSEALTQDQLADSLETAPIVETPPAQETEAEGEVETQETETVETEETPEYQLPTEQEKVYSQETLLQYAQERWPKIHAMLVKDPNNEALTDILKGKLDADIYIQQLQQQPEPEEEAEPEAKPEPTQPQLTTQQWMDQVARKVDEITDPEVAQLFAGQFLQAFGVKEAPTPEMAKALTRVMGTFGLNLMNTVLPQMLNSPMPGGKPFIQGLVEQHYPEFGDMYERQAYQVAWDRVKESNPAYASLPNYGTPEFTQTLQRAAQTIPGFDDLQFTKNGKTLPPIENSMRKYSILAKVAAGEKLNPAQSKAVFEAGKKAARKQEVNRQAGNLGSGKSAGQIASNPSDADFWKEGTEIYQREHGRL